MNEVRGHVAAAIRSLRQRGINLSDRRLVQAQRLIAAAAVLNGRTAATRADLWPLVYAIPTHEAQQEARTELALDLEPSDNATVSAAAEDASLGPLARARRLMASGQELLQTPPRDDAESTAIRGWRARLEGVAREIDASFSADQLPDDLTAVREAIVTALAQ
jgi:MoxR-like ATPase